MCTLVPSRENVGYASSCNSIGIQMGYNLSYVAFLAGTSPEFADYFRDEPRNEGLFTMQAFLGFWGVVFICVTILLTLLRLREPEQDAHDAAVAAAAAAGTASHTDVGRGVDSEEVSLLRAKRYLVALRRIVDLKGVCSCALCG